LLRNFLCRHAASTKAISLHIIFLSLFLFFFCASSVRLIPKTIAFHRLSPPFPASSCLFQPACAFPCLSLQSCAVHGIPGLSIPPAAAFPLLPCPAGLLKAHGVCLPWPQLRRRRGAAAG
jgi:hypothetical protein